LRRSTVGRRAQKRGLSKPLDIRQRKESYDSACEKR
jgi:hypothetical protein